MGEPLTPYGRGVVHGLAFACILLAFVVLCLETCEAIAH